MEVDQYRVLRWNVSDKGCFIADDSHVAKTDDIKDFVITEESSIAKGIRRVVAVTGHDAHEVSRKAVEYETKLERIEQLQGKEKDAAMKPYLIVSGGWNRRVQAYSQELGQSGISLVKKQQLRERFDKISAEVAAAAKAKLAADQKLVSHRGTGLLSKLTRKIGDEIKKFFTENPNESVYVGQFGIGGNPKVLSGAATTAKALGKAVYVFSPDTENGKVAHVNYLPKAILERKVLDAKVWLGEVSKIVGGKVSRRSGLMTGGI